MINRSGDNKLTVAIIMPLFNADTTVVQTLESLFKQSRLFDELIIINDGSTDNSLKLVNDFLKNKNSFLKEKGISLKIINHLTSQGLAASYNDGIKHSSSRLVVTLHSDILLVGKNALEELVKPFFRYFTDSDVVATYHLVTHPYNIWQKYNFWQKCFFSRLVGKKLYGLDGKFDCFKKNILEKVGLFDQEKFKNAGEDGDIVYKLKKKGDVIKTEAEMVHLHSMDPKFSFKDIIRKHKQYAESRGILLRLGEIENVRVFFKTFFREILVISLLIPYIQWFSLILIILYSILYTKIMFFKEYQNPRIFILPFLNIYLLFVSLFYSSKGFIYEKQKI